jgi:WD40 repeat protein
LITPTQTLQFFQLRETGTGRRLGAPLYSSDGKWLFLPTANGVFVLDASSYQVVRLLKIASETYENKVLSPDGEILVFENKLISTIDGHIFSNPNIPAHTGIGAIRDVMFSPDSTLLVVIYNAYQLDVWQMKDGQLLYSLQAESAVFSPDSHLMAVGSDLDENPYIQLYESKTGLLLKNWAGERAEFLSDDHLAVETKGATRVYDLASNKVPYAFNGGYAAFSPDGNLVALFYLGQVEIRQVIDGKLLYKLEGDFKDIYDLDLNFAPNGQTLLGYAYWLFCCGGWEHRLFLWRVDDGSLIKETKKFIFYNFPSDGSSLAVTTENGLEIWNTVDGSIRAELNELPIP